VRFHLIGVKHLRDAFQSNHGLCRAIHALLLPVSGYTLNTNRTPRNVP
jgi:hypothetical protein